MRISQRVYLTASGRQGCSLSRPEDCNAYAVDCGGCYLLIDSGAGGADAILRSLERHAINPAHIYALLLTHAHLDHSGGAAALHAALGVPVWCSPECAKALEEGDEEAISLGPAKRAGIYPDDFPFTPCPVVRRLEDTSTPICVGDSQLTVLRTPGHSHDMLTYIVDTGGQILAFPGDTVFHGGRVLLSPNWDCDPRALSNSLRTLAKTPFDGLYPGHGIWSIQDGPYQVQQSLSYLHRLLVPPNLF